MKVGRKNPRNSVTHVFMLFLLPTGNYAEVLPAACRALKFNHAHRKYKGMSHEESVPTAVNIHTLV